MEVTRDEYLDSLREIMRLNKIVDAYLDQEKLSKKTRFKGLSVSDFDLVDIVEPDFGNYISFHLKERQIQRISKLRSLENGFSLENSRFFYSKDEVCVKLFEWLKRNGGFDGNKKEFINSVKPRLKFLEKSWKT